jgi:hypothetical protein
MPKFNITYEIVSQESAEYGDSEENGFVCEDVKLREAIDALFETRTNRVDCIQSIEYSGNYWFTVNNGIEYETGSHESRSIHIPRNTTQSSINRLAKLIGATI